MRLSWLYLLVAVALASALGLLVHQSSNRTPADLMASATRRATGPDHDLRGALADLDLALRLAEVDGGDELVADILVERARIQQDLGAWTRARADLNTVLERLRPGDLDVETQLVQVELRAGDLDAALRRSERVLARAPARVDALTYRGQVLVQLADAAMVECERACRAALPQDKTDAALRLAHRAAGLAVDDSRRPVLLNELRRLFDSSQEMIARDLIRLLDRASGQIAEARTALAAAFRGPPLRATLDDYARLLERSGRGDELVDFGLAAVHHPSARTWPPFLQRLMEAMLERKRPDRAARLLDRHFDHGVVPGPDFYRAWCEVLFQSGRWDDLVFVSDRLRDAADAERESVALFYNGVARTRVGQHDYAPMLLRRYVNHDPVEPREGALALSWRMLAFCYREQGQDAFEKEALRAAARADPDGGRQAGVSWWRLAELLQKTEPTSLYEAEVALTHAVRLLPELSGDLLPVWTRVGREELAAAQVGIEAAYDAMVAEGRFSPAGPAGPFELVSLAQMHAERDLPAGVVSCCKRMLTDFPGFLPALDLYVEAAMELEDHDRVAQLLLERMDLAGPDDRSLARLAALPEGTLGAEQVLGLMRLDPEGHGRMRVAQHLFAAGREREALEGLLSVDRDLLGDEERLLAGRLMLRLERLEGIDEMLSGISAGSPGHVEALPLRVEAALVRGERPLLYEALAALTEEPRLGGTGWVGIADRLLADGYRIEAQGLLRVLDERAENRSGEVLLRRAQVALATGAEPSFEEHLARAEAFLPGGQAELGSLIRAADRRAWTALPRLVEELEASQLAPTALQSAALDLLAERFDQARQRIDRARAAQPGDPLWLLVDAAARALGNEPLPGTATASGGEEPDAVVDLAAVTRDETELFLRGEGRGTRDPRQVLVRLLALQHPDWRAWALDDLAAARPGAPGALWPGYLRARGLMESGRAAPAADLARVLMRALPRFEPAWDLLESAQSALAAARSGDLEAPVVGTLDELRRRFFGRRPGDEAEELWRQAYRAEAAGDADAALASATRAATLDQLPARGALRLMRLHLRRGQHDEAVDALDRALEATPQASDSLVVQEALQSLAQMLASKLEPAVQRRVRNLRDSLARRFPGDPLVVLTLAEADVAETDLGPAAGLARAFDRLEAFRRETLHAPIDSLRRGAARPWMEFLARRDPARAEAFVRAELLRQPGSRDLWRMLGDAFVAQDRPDDAIEVYETLMRMLPDGATGRALITLLARSGRGTEPVQHVLDQIVRIERLPGPDIALEFGLAQALVQQGEETQDQGIALLADLWQRREGAVGEVDATDIGAAYGTALCWRSDPADRQLAHEVLREVAGAMPESSRRNLVHALANLALHMP